MHGLGEFPALPSISVGPTIHSRPTSPIPPIRSPLGSRHTAALVRCSCVIRSARRFSQIPISASRPPFLRSKPSVRSRRRRRIGSSTLRLAWAVATPRTCGPRQPPLRPAAALVAAPRLEAGAATRQCGTEPPSHLGGQIAERRKRNRSSRAGTSLSTKEDLYCVHKKLFMSTSLAMSNVRDEKPHPDVSADPICSRNCIYGDDDDWIIVKKQRITILIPPQSPITANPQSNVPTISSKQSCITRSKRDCDAARKKHPEKVAAKKCQDSPPVHGSIVHEDVPIMTGDKLPHSSVPVAKTEWTKDHAVRELFHQETGKATSFFGSMGKPRMPLISSPVANKIIRARLLERQVAGFGGLKNWLFGCGLGWFVNILDTEKLGMYQLASLTMKQLKDMGLVAVGPRRKLIHAIDSLCHPHHVEMLS